MNKRYTKLLLILLLTFIISTTIGCTNYKDLFYEEQSYYFIKDNVKEDWTWFNIEEFKNALEKKVYMKVEYKEIKKLIDKKESFVICYGFDPKLYQCPYCVACIPIVSEVLEEIGLDIYYLDIFQMRTDNSQEYLFLYNQLKDTSNDFKEKIPAPTYVSYINGLPQDYHIATIVGENGKYIKDLSVEQKQELKNIFSDFFLTHLEKLK